jgi:hypothetical protein
MQFAFELEKPLKFGVQWFAKEKGATFSRNP